MALPLYLAQTRAEMAGNPLPPRLAWMACQFSPGGSGLSNLPDSLPPGSMLILNDCMPMDRHDPERILNQLSAQAEKWQCFSILLDFQRAGIDTQQRLVNQITESLPCPVGVSEPYARGLSGPVFLPPVPPDRSLKDYLSPWLGREIWLEAALDGLTLTLTDKGCTVAPLFDFPEQGRQDDRLHCHYSVEAPAAFHLWRTRKNLDKLLEEAEFLGITKAVGLWQELGR